MKKFTKEEIVEPLIHMVLALIVAIAVGLLLWKAPHEEGFAIVGHKPVRVKTQQVAEVAEPLVVTPDEKPEKKPTHNAVQADLGEESILEDEQAEIVEEATAGVVEEQSSTNVQQTVVETTEEQATEVEVTNSAEMSVGDPAPAIEPETEWSIGDPPELVEPEMVMDIGEPPGPIEPEMVMDIGEPPGPIEPDIGPPIEIPDIGPAIWIDEDGNTVTASSEGEIIIIRPLVEETVDEN